MGAELNFYLRKRITKLSIKCVPMKQKNFEGFGKTSNSPIAGNTPVSYTHLTLPTTERV